MTKREAIDGFREMIKERNADSTYSNQSLYNRLMDQAKWLIKREISNGKIYKNTSFFQTLRCQDVEEDLVNPCCPVSTGCKVYRTRKKVPRTWLDNDGPIIKSVTSIDGSRDFHIITSPKTWQAILNDPYSKGSSQLYALYADERFWFTVNPHKINIYGFYTDDIQKFNGCSEKQDCVRFLDTQFMVPDWVHAEMYAKAVQLLMPSKQLPDDLEINKNDQRRGYE